MAATKPTTTSPLRQSTTTIRDTGLRLITITRSSSSDEGFGFRLRHFVKYPDAPSNAIEEDWQRRIFSSRVSNSVLPVETLDTVFVVLVKENGPAHQAGLSVGDRVVSVNGELVVGRDYSDIVQMIQKSGPVLKLAVTPKENDILQQCFPESAYNPTTNLGSALSLALPAAPFRMAPVQTMNPQVLTQSPVVINQVLQPSHQGPVVSRPAIMSHLPRPKPYQPFILESPTNQTVKPPTASTATSLTSTMNPKEFAIATLSRTIRKAADNETFLNEARSRASLATAHSVSYTKQDSLIAVNKRSSYSGRGVTREELLRNTYSLSTLQSSPQVPVATPELSAMDRFKKSHEQKEEFFKRPAQSLGILQEARRLKDTSSASVSEPVLEQTAIKSDVTGIASGVNFPSRTLDPTKHANQKLAALLASRPTVVQNSVPKPFYGSGATIQKKSEDSGIPSRSTHESDSPAASAVSQPLTLLVPTKTNEEQQSNPKLVKKETLVYRTIKFEKDRENKRIATVNPYKAELTVLEEKGQLLTIAQRKKELEAANSVGSATADATTGENLQNSGRASAMEETPRPLSGNRTVIIGSNKLHCDPPKDYHPEISVLNSKPQRSLQLTIPQADDKTHDSDSNFSTPSPIIFDLEQTVLESFNKWASETHGSFEDPDDPKDDTIDVQDHTGGQVSTESVPASNTETKTENSPAVPKRQKLIHDPKGDRTLRRISYLKATAAERRKVESIVELSNEEKIEEENNNVPVAATDTVPELKPQQSTGQKLRLRLASDKNHFFRTFSHSSSSSTVMSPLSPVKENKENCLLSPPQIEVFNKEGWLYVKHTLVDGNKRAHDRSWKQWWARIQNWTLLLSRDKKDSSGDVSFDLRLCSFDIATDYTKRKHVIRLNLLDGIEYLFQCEDYNDMQQWVNLIKEYARIKDPANQSLSSFTGSQSPGSPKQRPMEISESLLNGTKGHGMKSTTSSQTKSRTFKEVIASKRRKKKNYDKNSTQRPTNGASFDVSLELCPKSPFTENIPFIVELCVRLVEARGLQYEGIYRRSGSVVSIAALTDMVNKGVQNIDPKSPLWSDFNVIAGLLKSFFRKLPEPLISFDLFSDFVQAGKDDDKERRANTLKKLLEELPDAHYVTLRYVIQHLAKVVQYSHINKMESSNLGIVFGPTLIRSDIDDKTCNATAAADVLYQNRCIETLIERFEFIFPKPAGEVPQEYTKQPDPNNDNEVDAEIIIRNFLDAMQSNGSLLETSGLSPKPSSFPKSQSETLGFAKSLGDLAPNSAISPELKGDRKTMEHQTIGRKRSASLGGNSILQESISASSLTDSMPGIQNMVDIGQSQRLFREFGSISGSTSSLLERFRRSDANVKAILQRREQLKENKNILRVVAHDIDINSEEHTSSAVKTENIRCGLTWASSDFLS